MLKFIYPAIFHEDSDGVWVEFPDLAGCQSFGDTVMEVRDRAKEALKAYCAVLLEQHRELPAPSDIKKIKAGENAFAELVDAEEYPSVSKKTPSARLSGERLYAVMKLITAYLQCILQYRLRS